MCARVPLAWLPGAEIASELVGIVRPRLSAEQRVSLPPCKQLGEFACKWGCKAKASSQESMNAHYYVVRKAIAAGSKVPCSCPGPAKDGDDKSVVISDSAPLPHAAKKRKSAGRAHAPAAARTFLEACAITRSPALGSSSHFVLY
jgi:hypothetical protein